MSSIPAESIARVRSLVAGTVTPLPEDASDATEDSTDEVPDAAAQDDAEDGTTRKKRRRRRRRRGRRGGGGGDSETDEASGEDATGEPDATPSEPQDAVDQGDAVEESPSAEDSEEDPPAKPRRRSLYGSQRRRVPPTTADRDQDR